MEIRKGRRVVYALHAHMVFVSKRRGKVFNIAHLERLEEICRDVCSDFEAELKEFNGERDHVHLLVAFLNWSTASRAFPAGSSSYSSQQFPPSGACERAGARYGPRAISLVRLAAPLLRSFGSTLRTKGALTPRRERRGPSRYSVALCGREAPKPGMFASRATKPGDGRISCRKGFRRRCRPQRPAPRAQAGH